MNESTKKVLIITTGVLAIVVALLIFLPDIITLFGQTITCKDGSTVPLLNPERFKLKYSGKKIIISTELKNEITQSFGIEDKVLQEAIDATQILDQYLLKSIVDYNISACAPEGTRLLQKINNYKAGDLLKIMALQKEIAEITKSKNLQNKESLKKLINETGQAATSATTRLNAQ